MCCSVGAFLISSVRSTFKKFNPLQSVFSRAGETRAHRDTAGEEFEYLSQRETCSRADVTVEDSRPGGSSRRFHLIIWLDDQRRDNLS